MTHIFEIKYDPSVIAPEYLLQPASKFIPEWYKSLPARGFVSYLDGEGNETTVATVRSCPGIIRGMSSGFILPCPFDFYVKTWGTKYEVTTAMGREHCIDVHDPAQANFATGSNFLILKIRSLFTVWGDDDVDFIYVNPVMHNFAELKELQIPTGRLEFKNQHSINAFVMFPLGENDNEEEKVHFVRQGYPIAQFIPVTKNQISFKRTECNNWEAPPPGTLSGMTTWFDRLKYLRRMEGD